MRTWLGIVLLGALMTGFRTPIAESVGIAPEYELKAAFLYHFLKYADWPTLNPDSSLRILVAAPDGVVHTLRSSLIGKTVRNRTIAVQRVTKVALVPPCDLVFVAGLERDETAAVLEQFRGQPVLTVGEGRGFRDAGGMIELRLVEQRVRLRINLDATEQAGVRLHPSLLTVADVAPRRRPEAKQ